MLQDAISKMDPTVSNHTPKPTWSGSVSPPPPPALLTTLLLALPLLGFSKEPGRFCPHGAGTQDSQVSCPMLSHFC